MTPVCMFRIVPLVSVMFAAGCYLPTDFIAQLQIDKRGNFIFR